MDHFFAFFHGALGAYLIWLVFMITTHNARSATMFQFLPAIGGVVLLFESAKGFGLI